jgi:hypothetical protein
VRTIEETEDGPLIGVHFDTGREKRFFSLYQSAAYTKLGGMK